MTRWGGRFRRTWADSGGRHRTQQVAAVVEVTACSRENVKAQPRFQGCRYPAPPGERQRPSYATIRKIRADR